MRQSDLQHPRQRQHRQSLDRLSLLSLSGSLGRCKQAVGHHQNRNQRQKEDGVGSVRLAVSGRHLVARRFE